MLCDKMFTEVVNHSNGIKIMTCEVCTLNQYCLVFKYMPARFIHQRIIDNPLCIVMFGCHGMQPQTNPGKYTCNNQCVYIMM